MRSFSKTFSKFNMVFSGLFSMINDSQNTEKRAKMSMLKPVFNLLELYEKRFCNQWMVLDKKMRKVQDKQLNKYGLEKELINDIGITVNNKILREKYEDFEQIQTYYNRYLIG